LPDSNGGLLMSNILGSMAAALRVFWPGTKHTRSLMMTHWPVMPAMGLIWLV
jgi:hypothetical protein